MRTKELDYETVHRAVHGDHEAQVEILNYYDGYINALATITETNPEGSIRRYIDEDLKAAIQEEYYKALSKCKVIK